MAYDVNKLLKLAALKALAERAQAGISANAAEIAKHETAIQGHDTRFTQIENKVEGLVTAGGEPNVLEGVKVNGTALDIADKMVNILIATGSANGTVAVNGVDVAVKGLAALAYKAQVSESDLDAALKTVLAAKAAQSDVTALQNTLNAVKEDVDTFFADADLTANAKDTLKEIQEYIDSDATAAGEMTASIQQNKTAIEGLVALVGTLPEGANATTVVGYIAEAIEAIGIGDYAKTSEVTSAISAAIANYYTKTESDNKYVAKVSGKGLSTNDYTTAEKTKLEGISTGANKVEKSSTNGNIKVDGTEVVVYTEPSDVVHGAIASDAEITEMLNEVFA